MRLGLSWILWSVGNKTIQWFITKWWKRCYNRNCNRSKVVKTHRREQIFPWRVVQVFTKERTCDFWSFKNEQVSSRQMHLQRVGVSEW